MVMVMENIQQNLKNKQMQIQPKKAIEHEPKGVTSQNI